MQGIAREIHFIVDNLLHLLIKVMHFVDFCNINKNKGLEHFC